MPTNHRVQLQRLKYTYNQVWWEITHRWYSYMSLYKWVIPFFLLSPPVFLLLQSNLGVWLTTPCPAWLLNWASLCWQHSSHEHWRHECSSNNIAQKWKESCSCPFCSWKHFFLLCWCRRLIAMELHTGKFLIHPTRECFNLQGTLWDCILLLPDLGLGVERGKFPFPLWQQTHQVYRLQIKKMIYIQGWNSSFMRAHVKYILSLVNENPELLNAVMLLRCCYRLLTSI